MRQIEKDMVQFISRGVPGVWQQANTKVDITGPCVEVYLHGHLIAARDNASDKGWRWNLCGWNTPTTRSRLNALGCRVATKAGQPHVMGRAVPTNDWFVA